MSTASCPRPLYRRIVDTFVSPVELFGQFRDHPPWGGPLLLMVTIGIAVAALIPGSLLLQQAQQAPKTMDPSTVEALMRVSLLVGALFLQPALTFVYAGILFLIFGGLLGGRARYTQYLAVTTHAMLIFTVGGLLTMGLQVVGGNAHIRLSAALLVPLSDPRGVVATILRGLEVFTLWTVVLFALGASAVNHELPWARSTAVLLGVYVAILAATALL
jgi:hypothetical protein